MIRTMPRPKPEVPTVSVLLRMTPDRLAVLDRLRGKVARGAFVANMILERELMRIATERADASVQAAAKHFVGNLHTQSVSEIVRSYGPEPKAQPRSWDGSPIEATKRGPRPKGGK